MSPYATDLERALRLDGLRVEPPADGHGVPLVLPASEAEVSLVLERAHADGLRVLPTGLGSKLAWCRPEAAQGSFDLHLSTRALDRIVDDVPGDGTLTAQAGCRMSALEERVVSHGHYLTPTVPRPEDATLGGTLAAGVSGADRIRFGPSRHHVLGMRVALADGTRCASGGRLVKNVTGFDLHRLYTGSRGTLCVLLEASLRLFPLPEAWETWRAEGLDGEGLAAAAEETKALGLRPFAARAALVSADPGRGTWTLDVLAGGTARQLAAEREALRRASGSRVWTVQEPVSAAEGAVGDARGGLCHGRAPGGGGGSPTLRVTCLPSQLPPILDRVLVSTAHLLSPAQPPTVEPLVASLDLVLEPDALASQGRVPAAFGPQELLRLAETLRPLGGRVEARALPLAYHAALAPPLSARPDLAWMSRLAQRFDPQGLFASPIFPGLPADVSPADVSPADVSPADVSTGAPDA